MEKTEKVLCHKVDLDNLLKQVENWKITDVNKNKVPQFINDYSIGKITGRTSNNQGALARNLYYLKNGLENLKSETVKGVEDFLDRLLKDKIKHKGGEYTLRSKRDIINILVRYLEWKHPNKKITAPLKIKIKTKKKDIVTYDEKDIKTLIKATNLMSRKYLFAVLNSSGMRAEEFHNVRFSDITLPTGNEQFVSIRVRNEFSKTEGRTIKLYDKNVLPIVRKYLAQRIKEGIKPEEVVFPVSYHGNAKWLRRFTLSVLDKSINYHMFRHTAATRLCSKLNRQQLCVYFGWKFNSPMPDVYIQRSGVDMQDVDVKFEKTRIEELESDMEEYKHIVGFIMDNSKHFDKFAPGIHEYVNKRLKAK